MVAEHVHVAELMLRRLLHGTFSDDPSMLHAWSFALGIREKSTIECMFAFSTGPDIINKQTWIDHATAKYRFARIDSNLKLASRQNKP